MEFYSLDKVFYELKKILDIEINLLDKYGCILASTEDRNIGKYDLNIKKLGYNYGIVKNEQYLYIKNEKLEEYFISIENVSYDIEKIGKVIEFFLSLNIKDISKDEFIKKLFIEGMDVNKFKKINKKFNICFNTPMQALVIKLSEEVFDEVEKLFAHIFPEETYVKIDNSTYGFIKKINNETIDLEKNIFNYIYTELLFEPEIGVGIIVNDIMDLYVSYEKAKLAVELGAKLKTNKKVFYYRDIGIPMLIKNMDYKSLNDLFIDIYQNIETVISDIEMLNTVLKFFEKGLNISETAKALYIHRNTLIYRLNKIQKLTGYDLRKFEDSINFKVAMDIKLYLQNSYNN